MNFVLGCSSKNIVSKKVKNWEEIPPMMRSPCWWYSCGTQRGSSTLQASGWDLDSVRGRNTSHNKDSHRSKKNIATVLSSKSSHFQSNSLLYNAILLRASQLLNVSWLNGYNIWPAKQQFCMPNICGLWPFGWLVLKAAAFLAYNHGFTNRDNFSDLSKAAGRTEENMFVSPPCHLLQTRAEMSLGCFGSIGGNTFLKRKSFLKKTMLKMFLIHNVSEIVSDTQEETRFSEF